MSATSYWREFWARKSIAGLAADEHDLPTEANPEYYRREAAVIKLLTGLDDPRSVLELGCGGGQLYEAMGLQPADYTGVDVSASMLATFRERHPGVRLIVADGSSFCDDTRKYDLIFSVSAAHYFDRAMFRNHLRNARKMLAPGGVLFCGELRWHALFLRKLYGNLKLFRLTKPRHDFSLDLRGLYYQTFHTNEFSMSELHRIGRDEGFSCEIFGSVNVPGTLHVCYRPLLP